MFMVARARAGERPRMEDRGSRDGRMGGWEDGMENGEWRMEGWRIERLH
jgi:hypothetical protein